MTDRVREAARLPLRPEPTLPPSLSKRNTSISSSKPVACFVRRNHDGAEWFPLPRITA